MAKTKSITKSKKSDASSSEFGYDPDKDVTVKDFGIIEGGGGRAGDFQLRIISYNGGPNKLALTRTGENKETGNRWFSPRIGRLSLAELEALLPVLERALKLMAKKSAKKGS